MNPAHLLWMVPLLALLGWAAVEDFRTRRIRNWLTFSMLVSGFLQTFLPLSHLTPLQSVLGFALGFTLPLVLFVLRRRWGGREAARRTRRLGCAPSPPSRFSCVQAVIGMVIVLIAGSLAGSPDRSARNGAVLAVNLIHVEHLGLDTRHRRQILPQHRPSAAFCRYPCSSPLSDWRRWGFSDPRANPPDTTNVLTRHYPGLKARKNPTLRLTPPAGWSNLEITPAKRFAGLGNVLDSWSCGNLRCLCESK